ncbi:MAG: histidinol dehydrogenase [Desulfonauticus sp.]|nr:histidinol dehydrogenase [Desulfonauticus sp.]
MIVNRFSYKKEADWQNIKKWLAKRNIAQDEVEETVKNIIKDVQQKGDLALLEYTKKFDCPDFDLSLLVVSEQEMEEAFSKVDKDDLDIIQEAKQNIFNFHLQQKEKSWFCPNQDGAVLGQLVTPVQRAGLYIPGGQGGETPLISSLLMNAIPALIAGVEEIILVSPPRKDGTLNPYLLTTAHLLGVKKIFKLGSAWAIAALALGTESIPQVDIIVGPGNVFVTMAKKILHGQVGIDMIAGPSEIVVLADKEAEAKFVAADLLSQAEHDPMAASILISPSPILVQAVEDELQRQVESLPRKEIALQSLGNWGALIEVSCLEKGIELVNLIAPEHLELLVENSWDILGLIRNAGAIFMGEYTPEPVGDYFAGPNHVLPTMSTARFNQALGVETFYKKTSLIYSPSAYLQKHGAKIARLARLEGLEAHARSVEVRLS